MTVKRATWGKDGDKKTVWAATFYDEEGKRHRKQGFATRKLAEAWEREEREYLGEMAEKPSSKIIEVGALCDEWLEVVEKGSGERQAIEAASLKDYELSVRLYIKPLLGKEIASDLTSPHIVNFRKELLDKASRNKAQRVLKHLRQAFNYGVEIGYMPFNPAQSVKIAEDRRVDKTVQIPSRAEMFIILTELDKLANEEITKDFKEKSWLRFVALFRVLQGAGLRISEARGLAWDAVDLDAAMIAVRQRADNKGAIGKVKSRKAYRSVVVGDSVVASLRLWKEYCYPSQQNLVFPSRDGKPLLYSNLYKHSWVPLCKRVKLLEADGKPKYAFHAARHFRVSEKIAVGANLKEIMSEIGHASSALTIDRYGHLFPEDFAKQREQAAEIERKLGQKSVK